MKRIALVAVSLLLALDAVRAGGRFVLPPLPAPERYGEVLMQVPPSSQIAPVVFSHLTHRTRYTCRVCHYEIGFSMQANATPIVCDDGAMKGDFCARCHDGRTAFGARDAGGGNCQRCHGGDVAARKKEYDAVRARVPPGRYGNEIDWSAALLGRFIQPRDSLTGKAQKLANIGETLHLKAQMWGIPEAVFPHQAHEEWMDCSNCHPDIFQMKRGTTRSLSMNSILGGESCGLCHTRVAFPLDDCRKCHPKMKGP